MFATTALAHHLDSGLFLPSAQVSSPFSKASTHATTEGILRSHPAESNPANKLYPETYDQKPLEPCDQDTTSQNCATTNWAGVAIEIPDNGDQPDGDQFNLIQGHFFVPQPIGSTKGGAAIWVGIDGFKSNISILQVGIQITIDDLGGFGYNSWYQWYPNPSRAIDSSVFNFTATDGMFLMVSTDNSTCGNVTLINTTTGLKWSTQVCHPEYPLSGQSAEWIVEDYYENGNPVTFADFDFVVFDRAIADTIVGFQYTPLNGTVVEMTSANNDVITQVTPLQPRQVNISYARVSH